jgi:ribose transport system substrate-binding protein
VNRKFLAALASTVLLIGCTSGASSSVSTSTAPPAPASSAPSASAAALKLCAAKATTSNGFDAGTLDGFKQEAAALGASFAFADAKEDANTQIQQLTDMITSGCSGIAVHSASAKALGDGIRNLNATIPIITFDRLVDPPYGGTSGANPRLHVGWSELDLAKITGDLVVAACKTRNPCNLILMTGVAGSSPSIFRTKGVVDAVAANPNIKMIDQQPDNWDPQGAATLTESLITKHKDIDVIVNYNDGAALAIVSTLKQNNRFQGKNGQVQVIGNGGSKAGLASISAGEMFGTAYVGPVSYAKKAFDILKDIIDGKTVTTEDVDGRPTVLLPVGAVTKDNAAQYPGEW